MNTETLTGQQKAVQPARGIEGSAKWMALAAAVLGWMFDGLEMGIFPLVGRPALTEMLGKGVDIGPWFGYIIATFLVGAAFGGFALGWLGDRIGRTRAMVWSVLAYSVFSGLGAIATAPWHLAVLRFLAALGMGGQWALGVALVMEIFPSKSRPLMAGIIGASANIGFLLIAALSIGLSSILAGLSSILHGILPEAWANVLLQNGSWRLLMILSAFPALLTFIIRVFVPESEMWEANSKKTAKVGLGDLFRNGLAKHTILGAALGAVALIGTWASVQWIPAWAGKLAVGVPNVAAKVQIASALGAIAFNLAFVLVAERFNRRITYFTLSLLSLIACAVLFRMDLHFGASFQFWTFVVGGITAGFYGLLPLYLPELFPTRVRAMGSGVTFNAGRLVAAFGAVYGGVMVKSFGGDIARMCSIVSLVYVLGLVVIWFAPETKGKPLPE
jgi:MFS family permease